MSPRRLQINLAALWPLLPLLLSLTLGSCEQRPLCYDHSHHSPVDITFDWSAAPDADPSTMVVWFFPVDGTAGSRYELTKNPATSRTEFNSTLKVPPGEYFVVTHNGDTDNNSERGNTFDSYCLLTYEDRLLSPMNRTDEAPRPSDTESQPIRAEASALYAHTLTEKITVEPATNVPVHITLTPVEATAVWDIRVTGIENLTPDIEASAVITGVAETWHPATSRPAGREVTIPLPLAHCGSDCLRGTVTLFGDAAPHDIPHKLRIYTSHKYYYDFDITVQVHNAAVGTHHIDIRVSGIKLPDVSGDGSGMSPGVSDWESAENIVIPM